MKNEVCLWIGYFNFLMLLFCTRLFIWVMAMLLSCSRLIFFKGIEFEGFKIRVIHFFPNANKFQSVEVIILRFIIKNANNCFIQK